MFCETSGNTTMQNYKKNRWRMTGMAFINKVIKRELQLGIEDLPIKKHFYFQTSYKDFLWTSLEDQRRWPQNVTQVRQRAERRWEGSQIRERWFMYNWLQMGNGRKDPTIIDLQRVQTLEKSSRRGIENGWKRWIRGNGALHSDVKEEEIKGNNYIVFRDHAEVWVTLTPAKSDDPVVDQVRRLKSP